MFVFFNYYFFSLYTEDEAEQVISPLYGNVCFASSYYRLCFTQGSCMFQFIHRRRGRTGYLPSLRQCLFCQLILQTLFHPGFLYVSVYTQKKRQNKLSPLSTAMFVLPAHYRLCFTLDSCMFQFIHRRRGRTGYLPSLQQCLFCQLILQTLFHPGFLYDSVYTQKTRQNRLSPLSTAMFVLPAHITDFVSPWVPVCFSLYTKDEAKQVISPLYDNVCFASSLLTLFHSGLLYVSVYTQKTMQNRLSPLSAAMFVLPAHITDFVSPWVPVCSVYTQKTRQNKLSPLSTAVFVLPAYYRLCFTLGSCMFQFIHRRRGRTGYLPSLWQCLFCQLILQT